MKVGTLRKKLKEFKDDTEIIIDHDDNGWWTLEDVNASQVECMDGEMDDCVNLITSSEL